VISWKGINSDKITINNEKKIFDYFHYL